MEVAESLAESLVRPIAGRPAGRSRAGRGEGSWVQHDREQHTD
jgi:hypothetical protein